MSSIKPFWHDIHIFSKTHSDPMWIFDADTLRIVEVNEAAVARYGYSRDEFLAMTILDIRPPEDREADPDVTLKRVAGFMDCGVWRHATSAGEIVHVDVRALALKDQDQSLVMVQLCEVPEAVACEADHTQLSAGAALRAQELRTVERRLNDQTGCLRSATQLLGIGFWSLDIDSLRFWWSEEVHAIFGVDGSTEIDLDAYEALIHPEDRAAIRAELDACIENESHEVLRFEHRVVTDDGGEVHVRGVAERMHDDGPRRLVGVVEDITALRKAAGERRQAAEAMELAGRTGRETGGSIVATQGASQDDDAAYDDKRRRGADVAARLAQTLEEMSDAFYTLNQDWNFTFANSSACRLLRNRNRDLIGRSIWDVFPDLPGSQLEQSYRRAVATRKPVLLEYFSPRLDQLFSIRAHPITEGIAVYFHEITAERAQEDHLRLLEAAVAQQTDMLEIATADTDTTDAPQVIYVNPAFERITGYTAAEAIGQPPLIHRGPITDRATLDQIRTALLKGEGVKTELINYRKDGTPYWKEIDIRPLHDASGVLTHFITVGRDITRRKDADHALRMSEERFRLIARATSDVIWDEDLTSGRLWFNDELTSVFGHAPADGDDPAGFWAEHLHPDDAPAVHAGILSALESDTANWSARYRFRHADGSWATVDDRAQILRDDTGQAVRMLGSMTDITEKLHLEDALRQAQKLEAVGQLTGGVAHDFNNLLTVILGNAEQLTQDLAHDHRLQEMAEMTASAAVRASELTSRLLAFARRQALRPKVVELNQLVTGLEGLMRRTLSEEIDVEFRQSDNLWLAEVDPGQLEVALLNLVINARDAMPQGGRILIETANVQHEQADLVTAHDIPSGQYVMVTVKDDGTGMPPDVIARAFDPFFTTKDVGKGSGLGLSMVHGFLRQSNGYVRIDSELDEGTMVKLYFPRVLTTATGPAAEPTKSPADIVRGSEHVLVVEDDDMVRAHVVRQLVSLGYEVTEAPDGGAGLEVIRNRADIDLLFTDIVMPGGMSGYDLAEAAGKLRPDLPILFTSGYSENSISEGPLQQGAELLQKPYRRQQLARRLRQMLEG